jgi:hypothetical protein
MDENTGATHFWEEVIYGYTGGSFQQTSEMFTSKHSGTWPTQYYRFAGGQS